MTNRFVSKNIFKKVFGKSFDLQNKEIKLSFDTRAEISNSIFFAFLGEDFDGHDFIEAAFSKGALFAVADISKKEKLQNLDQNKIIFVNNPLAYYSLLAKEHLSQFKIIKIAITGSNGKTTTKNIVAAMLSHIFGKNKVYKTPGNKNNHIGIPMSALEINAGHEIGIFEIGMNHEGEIAHLCTIIKPNYGIITNVARAHEGNFKSGIEGIQKAKGELFASLHNEGIAIVNLDDERVVNEAHKNTFKKQVTFSRFVEKNADITLLSVKPFCFNTGSQELCVRAHGKNISFPFSLYGEHNAQNAGLALTLMYALGIPLDNAVLALKNIEPEKSRMQVINCKDNLTVVDDSYNANPASFLAGIAALSSFVGKRKIAAIGSMAELGEQSFEHHENLGKVLAKNFDQLFLCGPMADVVAASAIANGFSKEKIVIKKSSIDLIEPINAFIGTDDLLFLKGSNSNKMWLIADNLVLKG